MQFTAIFSDHVDPSFLLSSPSFWFHVHSRCMLFLGYCSFFIRFRPMSYHLKSFSKQQSPVEFHHLVTLTYQFLLYKFAFMLLLNLCFRLLSGCVLWAVLPCTCVSWHLVTLMHTSLTASTSGIWLLAI